MILLNSVVVVLNETIEAGILISVLLSISQRLALPQQWWRWGAVLGICGSLLYAQQLPTLSGWFDYGGQEVINSGLQLTVFALSTAVIYQVASHRQSVLTLLLALAMGLAMVREGAEIVVFYLGVSAREEALAGLITSGFVGAAIGASIGALGYYWLVLMKGRYARWIQLALLALIASGMVLQASQLLIQIDWLPMTAMLWDSNSLLPENSPLGQLAYAIFGYESTPGAVEVALYGSAAVISCTAFALGKRAHAAASARGTA